MNRFATALWLRHPLWRVAAALSCLALVSACETRSSLTGVYPNACAWCHKPLAASYVASVRNPGGRCDVWQWCGGQVYRPLGSFDSEARARQGIANDTPAGTVRQGRHLYCCQTCMKAARPSPGVGQGTRSRVYPYPVMVPQPYMQVVPVYQPLDAYAPRYYPPEYSRGPEARQEGGYR